MSESKYDISLKLDAEGCARANDLERNCPADRLPWMLAYAEAEVQRLQEQVRLLREALQSLVDQGEPLRAQFELWSNWQPRVQEWKAARAVLSQTDPSEPEWNMQHD